MKGGKIKIDVKNRKVENVNNRYIKFNFELSKIEEEIPKLDGLLNYIEKTNFSI